MTGRATDDCQHRTVRAGAGRVIAGRKPFAPDFEAMAAALDAPLSESERARLLAELSAPRTTRQGSLF